jgi:hypothetical protein
MFQRPLIDDEKTLLREARNLHLRILIGVPIACLLLFGFTYQFGFGPNHKSGDGSVTGLEMVFIS